VERKEEGRMYKPILVMTTTMAGKTAAWKERRKEGCINLY
jgi:hypothetical protein